MTIIVVQGRTFIVLSSTRNCNDFLYNHNSCAIVRILTRCDAALRRMDVLANFDNQITTEGRLAGIWHQADDSGEWSGITVPDGYRYIVVIFFGGRRAPGVQVRQRLHAPRFGERDADRLLLVRCCNGPTENWFALTYPGVGLSINRQPIGSGMALLADRDLISFPPRVDQWVFTTESRARTDHSIVQPNCNAPEHRGGLSP